ncbi:FimV family protein [Comamonas serinivorans]|uniref:type IV pilus assembly protein FimV n=1 Tax=Comamonas serinivorans TaxID=1082851 RepID=UPI0012FB11C1|nr:FimV/HubP family polar landmark protein [Comamonas serinivorans]
MNRGDTAGRLAAANLPANVSLDQMLVAMLRANPDAFVGGNVNRLRAGAVLTLPTAEEASAVSTQQARRTIVAQSRDFNQYRQGLGRNAPRVRAAEGGQSAAGSVQSDVKAPTAAASDGSKLVVDPSSQETRKAAAAAKQAERAELNQRKAELDRTRKELEALATASKPAPSPSPVAAAPTPAPGITVPVAPVVTPQASVAAPATPVAPPAAPVVEAAASPVPAASELIALPAVDAASSTEPAANAVAPEASAPASAASAAATPKPKRSLPPPPPAPEPSFLDGVMDNPLPWGVGALAILGGLGFLASRARKKKATSDDGASDSEFIESRLQPDSFFDASGGQQVNTQEPRASTGNVTSMAYSPSQLDAAGDVDPVAEADVYLAYGRDMQAEEILKEALHTTPERVAIYRKLLEIYAKRRDTKAFEELATQLRDRTQGQGDDWAKVAELGNELDPGNPLYKGNSADLLSKAPVNAPVFGSSTLPSPDHLGLDDTRLDLELNGDSRLMSDEEERQRPKGLATYAAPPDTKAPRSKTTAINRSPST